MPDDDIFLAVVRQRIQRARQQAGLRQEDAAERANLPLRTYQRFEARTARRFNPTLLNLRAVAKAISIELPQLVDEPRADEVNELL